MVSSTAGRAALVSALRRPNAAGPLLPHVARTARALVPWQLEALVSDAEAEFAEGHRGKGQGCERWSTITCGGRITTCRNGSAVSLWTGLPRASFPGPSPRCTTMLVEEAQRAASPT